MKIASLLLLAIGLSSCVAKPYMVGSINDQIKPRCLFKYGTHDSHTHTVTTTTTTTVSSGYSTRGRVSSHRWGSFINPVRSGPMNPVH